MSPLRRHGAFYASCLAAFTAGHVVNYAVVLYAQEAIGADWLAGVGYGLCFGPPLVLGWVAGAWCDRHAPTRLIHGAQALFVLAALLLWAADALLADPAARAAPLLAAALLAGVGWSFVAPARMATLGQIVHEPADIKPATVAFNLFVMLGFGLGPVVIALARRYGGWPAVFATAAALFVVSSLALRTVRTRASGRAHAPLRAEIGEGVAAVRARPLLAQLMVAAIVVYLGMGPMTVALPPLAVRQLGLGELQRGAFLGALALALIAGGVAALALQRRLHHGRAIVVGAAAAGAALAALGAVHDARVGVALLAAVGIAGGLALSLVVAGIQAQAPDALRGRIVAIYTIVSQVVPAASGVAAGALVQALDAGAALQVSGAVLVAATGLGAWRMAALRRHAG